MGAFDHLSDTDERVIAHEESKLRRELGVKDKTLADYSTADLQAEIDRRNKPVGGKSNDGTEAGQPGY